MSQTPNAEGFDVVFSQSFTCKTSNTEHLIKCNKINCFSKLIVVDNFHSNFLKQNYTVYLPCKTFPLDVPPSPDCQEDDLANYISDKQTCLQQYCKEMVRRSIVKTNIWIRYCESHASCTLKPTAGNHKGNDGRDASSSSSFSVTLRASLFPGIHV